MIHAVMRKMNSFERPSYHSFPFLERLACDLLLLSNMKKLILVTLDMLLYCLTLEGVVTNNPPPHAFGELNVVLPIFPISESSSIIQKIEYFNSNLYLVQRGAEKSILQLTP